MGRICLRRLSGTSSRRPRSDVWCVRVASPECSPVRADPSAGSGQGPLRGSKPCAGRARFREALVHCVRPRRGFVPAADLLWYLHNFASQSEQIPASRTGIDKKGGKEATPASSALAARGLPCAARSSRPRQTPSTAEQSARGRPPPSGPPFFGDFLSGKRKFAQRGFAHFAQRSYANTKVTALSGAYPDAASRSEQTPRKSRTRLRQAQPERMGCGGDTRTRLRQAQPERRSCTSLSKGHEDGRKHTPTKPSPYGKSTAT